MCMSIDYLEPLVFITFFKISDISCVYRMPLLSGKTIRIMLSPIKKAVLNGQRYRNEMLAAFTGIVSSDSLMVSKQTIRFTACLLTTTFPQFTKRARKICENNTWPNLARAVLGKAGIRTRKRRLFSKGAKQNKQVQTELH